MTKKRKLGTSDGFVLSSDPLPTTKRYKRLDVEEADNGYVVSMWKDEKQVKVVCKDVKEVSETISKIMKK